MLKDLRRIKLAYTKSGKSHKPNILKRIWLKLWVFWAVRFGR